MNTDPISACSRENSKTKHLHATRWKTKTHRFHTKPLLHNTTTSHTQINSKLKAYLIRWQLKHHMKRSDATKQNQREHESPSIETQPQQSNFLLKCRDKDQVSLLISRKRLSGNKIHNLISTTQNLIWKAKHNLTSTTQNWIWKAK